MLRFLFAYLLIYTGIHGVIFHRFRILLPGKAGWTLCFLLFLLFMVLSPLLARVLEIKGYDLLARCMAFVGYIWMGFVFLAFIGSMVLYLLDMIFWAVRATTAATLPGFSGKPSSAILAVLCTGLVIYGYMEALRIRVEHIAVKTDKLPTGVEGIRVVQITDVHLGIINREKTLKHILDAVYDLSPDLLVCTGDLVDGSMQNLMLLTDLFNRIKPPLGRYAVTGNHEYYAGLEHSLAFMKKAGFDVLRQEVRTPGNLINIAGVDDGGQFGETFRDQTLEKVQNNLFTLYLKHRPGISEETLGKFDLQLSGHTHNGQIFPFKYVVSLEFKFMNGYYPLQKGSALYVSRGTGTWGPPMRIFSPPEITVIEIRNSHADGRRKDHDRSLP